MTRRRPTFVALVFAASAAFALVAPSGVSAKGANLLPNGDFEESAIEPGPAAGKSPQPVLPTGWAFEGSAGLFDHSPHGGSGGSARAAAISIPAGGKSSVCADAPVGCHANPANDPKNDEVAGVVSVNPAWRNAAPVPVVAGKKYELSADVGWELATEGEGAFGLVRWIYATPGTPRALIQVAPTVSTAFVVRSTKATSVFRPFTRVGGVVTAPSGAVSAVVLLGATDDVFLGQFRFDKAYFGLA